LGKYPLSPLTRLVRVFITQYSSIMASAVFANWHKAPFCSRSRGFCFSGAQNSMMSGHQTQITETFMASKPALLTGAAGAAAAVTPADQMTAITGQWLSTHGIGVLSYTEIIQVVGAVWVACLLVDRGIALVRQLVRK